MGASVAIEDAVIAAAAPGDDGSGYGNGGAVIVFSTSARNGLKDLTLTGGDNDDILVAADGDDVLMGGGGADFMRGNGGMDTLTGNGGGDGFFFDLTEDTFDIITDFTDGADLILVPVGTFTGGFQALGNGSGADLFYDSSLVAVLEGYDFTLFDNVNDVGFF